MRIAHVLPAYYLENEYNFEAIASAGGGERYPSELANKMAEKYDTTLITFGQSNYQFKHGKLHIRILKAKPFLKSINGYGNIISFRLVGALKEYDVIHAYQYYSDTTVIAALAALFYRKMFFVSDLGYRGLNVCRYFPTKFFTKKILALTAFENNRFNVNESKIRVIHGGVNLDLYRYKKEKSDYVMHIGRILPHKGIDTLIDSLDTKTKCIIAGHARNRNYLELLKAKAKGKNVEFLISAADKVVVERLRNARALILASNNIDAYGKKHKNSELFGLVIAEAFACGTPAIVTNTDALPYVVEDGFNGYVVPQNDPKKLAKKIQAVLRSHKLTEALGSNARKTAVDKYNWEKVVDCCIQEYRHE